MRNTNSFFNLLLIFTFIITGCSSEPKWNEFEQSTFDKAKKENKLVILNLKANWCHWCHVMSDSTYSNNKVQKYINDHFILTKADQDAHPSLANKYRNYGWPATIIFDANGNEIVKRRGYINPRNYLSLLKAIVADPTPETSKKSKVALVGGNIEDKIQRLRARTLNHLDYESGGYKQRQKYIDYDAFEYVIKNYKDPALKKWINNSIAGAYQLEDPAWSGIYQYSTHGDWKHLHYEKLLSIQARYINIFLDHHVITQSKQSLETAKRIIAYCDKFLLLDNGLYASAQDADLEAGKHAEGYFKLSNKDRLDIGIPRIDKNTYTNSNAAMAEALLRIAYLTDSQEYTDKALTIEKELSKNRVNLNGLYNHSSKTNTITLDDNIAMIKLYITFFQFTGSDKYKKSGLKLAKAVNFFKLTNNSYADKSTIDAIAPTPILSENIRITRILNLAGHLWDKELMEKAKSSFEYLYSNESYQNARIEGAMLLLAEEIKSKPLHLTLITTAKNNDLSAFTFNFPVFFKHPESTLTSELSKDQLSMFGSITKPTLFSCTATSCSMPITNKSNISFLLPYQ